MIEVRKWKLELNTLNKTYKNFQNELKEFLQNQPKVNEDNISTILKYFPAVVANMFYQKGSATWCFTVNEQLKNYDSIFGIGIETKGHSQNKRFFLLPTEKFGIGNFFILSEKNPNYNSYLIEEKSLEEKILALI